MHTGSGQVRSGQVREEGRKSASSQGGNLHQVREKHREEVGIMEEVGIRSKRNTGSRHQVNEEVGIRSGRNTGSKPASGKNSASSQGETQEII